MKLGAALKSHNEKKSREQQAGNTQDEGEDDNEAGGNEGDNETGDNENAGGAEWLADLARQMIPKPFPPEYRQLIYNDLRIGSLWNLILLRFDDRLIYWTIDRASTNK